MLWKVFGTMSSAGKEMWKLSSRSSKNATMINDSYPASASGTSGWDNSSRASSGACRRATVAIASINTATGTDYGRIRPWRQRKDVLMDGEFREGPADAHLKLRDELLAADRHYAPPAVTVRPMAADRAAFADVAAEVAETGLALRQLAEPPANRAFIELGTTLGEPMPERDGQVQQ